VAATGLSLALVWQGTGLAWSLLFFCFLMLAVTGFNVAGGLYRAPGAFILFNALLTMVIGVVGKIVLLEAADSNLQAPMHLMEAYMLGMASMCLASIVERVFRPNRSLMVQWFPITSLRTLYIGIATTGMGLQIFWLTSPAIVEGSVTSALRYADQMLPFAVILGVMYTVRRSNGKRSLTPFLIFIMTLMTLEGLNSYSKQGLFMGSFCWVLGAGVSRLRLRTVHYVTAVVVGFVLVYFGVTIVQAGKNLNRELSQQESIQQTMGLISNFKELRAEDQEEDDTLDSRQDVNYYNQPEGFLDRLEMVGIDDLLIDETDRDGYFGFGSTYQGFISVVPHFIWKNKPYMYYGNTYAHQLSLLSDDDNSTGVSFSLSADAYKEGGFIYGIVVGETLCLILVFCITSWVVGDVRDHPAAIILVLLVAHVAPEGAMSGLIQLILYTGVVLIVGLFSRYISPLIASSVMPPERLSNGALVTALD
jgi:hypothetical protein